MKNLEKVNFVLEKNEFKSFICALQDAYDEYKDSNVSFDIQIDKSNDDVRLRIDVKTESSLEKDLLSNLKKVLGEDSEVFKLNSFQDLKDIVSKYNDKREESLLNMCEKNIEDFKKLEEKDIYGISKGLTESTEFIKNLSNLYESVGNKMPEETVKICDGVKRMLKVLISRLYFISSISESVENKKFIEETINKALDQLQILESFK